MNRFGIAYGLLVMMLAGSPALGAEDAFVAEQTTKVTINAGGGWATVSIVEKAKAGSQVMANQTGKGLIIYCGCDVAVASPNVVAVENRDCKVESVDLRLPGLPHVVVTPDGQRRTEEVTACGAAVGGGAWWIVGGSAVAVGACAAAGCFDSNDDKSSGKPASP